MVELEKSTLKTKQIKKKDTPGIKKYAVKEIWYMSHASVVNSFYKVIATWVTLKKFLKREKKFLEETI